jgi:hypothetical protein
MNSRNRHAALRGVVGGTTEDLEIKRLVERSPTFDRRICGNISRRYALKRSQAKEAVMRLTVACLCSALGVLAATISPPAFAHESGAVAAQSVVQDQLDAFQRGDADSAFELASPELQADYDNAGNFLEIVRAKYAPFFHRRQLEFRALAIAGDAAAQGLQIVDEQGEVWNVIYELARQPDGSWAVANCFLLQANAIDI